jgi:beta-glucanase (GH16 family)
MPRRLLSAPLLRILALLLAGGCATPPASVYDEGDLSPKELAKQGVATDWELVWNDEFVGRSIGDHWLHEVNADGGGNNELQYYTDRPENSFVENGSLHIVARKEYYEGPARTRAYTSARINTSESVDWKYGRFEIRAKLPEGQGIWPAIWLLPTDSVYGTWAASGEIDIMELIGNLPGRVHGTLHYGGQWPINTHSGTFFDLLIGEKFSDGFHVFTLIWEEDAFHWYVDGAHYQTQTEWNTVGHPYPAPFDQEFHMVLNVAVGGNWPGKPDDTTEFPQEMVVDYVRVYQAASIHQ